MPSERVERYGERLKYERLPKEEEDRKQYANQVGADGWAVLKALDAPSTADWLKTLLAILTLRTIWEQLEPQGRVFDFATSIKSGQEPVTLTYT